MCIRDRCQIVASRSPDVGGRRVLGRYRDADSGIFGFGIRPAGELGYLSGCGDRRCSHRLEVVDPSRRKEYLYLLFGYVGGDGDAAVSYTHLDVYKRQVIYILYFALFWNLR